MKLFLRPGGFLAALLFLATTSLFSAEPVDSPRFVITDHGAVGDGQTMNTEAISALIDHVAAQGGGTIVIPRGVFLSGALFFKQGVHLHLEKDAVLKGSTNYADYKQVFTRWEGEERVWISAFLNFVKMQGVRLTGEGMIDGSGDEWTALSRRGGARGQASAAPAQTPAAPARPQFRGRPRMIAIENCLDVHVSGFQMKNQASWGLFVLYSENVLIENLTIRAEHNIPSSDGIDIDSSRHVRITGCDIDVNDDCIAIKAGKDEDGLRVNRPAEHILIENSRFRYGHGGVAMGSETSGGIRNVEVRNCIMDSDNWAPIRFKSQPSRGGVVENITFRDIQLNGTRKFVEFNMAWRMVNPKPPSDPLPIVRNVRIINVTGSTANVGDIRGLEGSLIDGITFENCQIAAERPLLIEHAKNIDLSGLVITGVEGEPVILRGTQ